MRLECCSDGWMITWIGDADRHPHYIAAGIPDALIPEASRILQAPIRSSSITCAKDANEFRSPSADKMWKRLCDAGVARYEEVGDHYVCNSGQG